MKYLIDRDDLENKIYKLIDPEFPDVMQTIYSQPSVDAVEVVRCKDCKKRNCDKYCNVHEFYVYDDYYCASGV